MRQFLITLLLVSGITWSFSQGTVLIPVWGNCGMCQHKIETTAKAIEGVDSAWWFPSADTLFIRLKPGVKPNYVVDKVCFNIANAGYDNSYYVAPDSSYNALHGCCKYARPDLGKYYCPQHPNKKFFAKEKCAVCGKKMVCQK